MATPKIAWCRKSLFGRISWNAPWNAPRASGRRMKPTQTTTTIFRCMTRWWWWWWFCDQLLTCLGRSYEKGNGRYEKWDDMVMSWKGGVLKGCVVLTRRSIDSRVCCVVLCCVLLTWCRFVSRSIDWCVITSKVGTSASVNAKMTLFMVYDVTKMKGLGIEEVRGKR